MIAANPAAMAQAPDKHPWILRVHHWMRSISFALLFVAITLHLWDGNTAPAIWILLLLQFFAYPHVLYWRASRAVDPVAAELDNLMIDSALIGVWIAVLAFPLWIAFSAMTATLINNAVNSGGRGTLKALLALAAGLLTGIALSGFHLLLDTAWPVTLFCLVGLTTYLLAMGNIGFIRNRQLRLIRQELRLGEKTLKKTNAELQNRLSEIDQLQEKLREQASRDALTGLYNRRYLDNTLERELARCKREGLPLALIMIDIDHFKRINDTYGHQAGDEMLRRLGETLNSMARTEDIACRYGGEEFLLLMPKMSLATAQERAEKLRAAFAAMKVPFGDFRLQTTLSIGIAIYPGHGKSVDALVQCADLAMYRAKHGGRNRVEVAAMNDDPQSSPEGGDRAFVRLVWKNQFNSGNPLIDSQHQALFADANELLGAILSGQPDDRVNSIIDALLENVKQHFHDEETIFGATAFNGSEEHAALHRDLLAKAETLVGRFHAGTIGLGELFEFLAHDLIAQHILNADRQYFPFLESSC